ncbi:hypothetical protein GGS21DRAFT_528115 [Xylaria nigripes]|nr:hypothetical protein GGS21DRAFT_528115 [Xylaria nigripes]
MKSWSFAQGVLYGESSVSLRDTDRVHDAKSYRFGVIFSAPHHTPGSIEERWVSVMDPHNTATPYGIVHSKYRKMVVLKAYGEHCICVPIYTHNGRGLEGKPFLQEWVSISDVADPNPAAPEGPHVKLHAVANPDFRGLVVAGRSCIKLSEICSHRYDSPATMEGRLDSDRTLPRKRLLRLVGIVE